MPFPILRRHCFGLALLAIGAHAQSPAPASTFARILVVGDSLSAEYGLKRGEGWVALLNTRLLQEHWPYQVVNASISGDTTAGGRSRLPALLALHQPAIVIIELGANDALRGLPLAKTQENLFDMAQAAHRAGARTLLIGMQVPPNYGVDYNRQFTAVYTQVAREQHTALVPFLLKDVADAPNANQLFQADQIHPLAQAHPTLLGNVWPSLKKMLKK